MERNDDGDDEMSERTSIREELSKMSFEELQKLKDKLGAKVYNEAMFGKRKHTNVSYKRENKNRPREMSSKHPIRTQNLVITTKKSESRDPRFDSLCGAFNEKEFRRSYYFLKDVKANEKEQLKKELKMESDAKRKENIKYLIQRLENQEREHKRREEKVKKEREEHNKNMELLKQGKKPTFLKKSEKKVLDLVEQFEDLKKRRKLHKHIEKYRRKNKVKDRKKMQDADMSSAV